jgi:hypothetical protein
MNNDEQIADLIAFERLKLWFTQTAGFHFADVAWDAYFIDYPHDGVVWL